MEIILSVIDCAIEINSNLSNSDLWSDNSDEELLLLDDSVYFFHFLFSLTV